MTKNSLDQNRVFLEAFQKHEQDKQNAKFFQYKKNFEELESLKILIEKNPKDDVLKLAAIMFLQAHYSLSVSFNDEFREKISIKKRDDKSSKASEIQNITTQRFDLAHEKDFLKPLEQITNLIKYELEHVKVLPLDLIFTSQIQAMVRFHPSSSQKFSLQEFKSLAVDKI